ncbi:MAG: hypothetical protein C4341_04845 [Armatimonadota bacterium]
MAKPFPHSVFVSTDRPNFPNVCVCCGAYADSEYQPFQQPRRMGMPEPVEPLKYPYCSDCVAHVRAAQGVDTAKLIAVNVGVWGVAVPMFANAPIQYLLVAPAFAAALYLRAVGQRRGAVRLKETCAHPLAACHVAWYRRSTYQFSFASERYAGLFRDANAGSLVEEP